MKLESTSLSVLGPLKALGAEPSKLGAVGGVRGRQEGSILSLLIQIVLLLPLRVSPQGFLLFYLNSKPFRLSDMALEQALTGSDRDFFFSLNADLLTHMKYVC